MDPEGSSAPTPVRTFRFSRRPLVRMTWGLGLSLALAWWQLPTFQKSGADAPLTLAVWTLGALFVVGLCWYMVPRILLEVGPTALHFHGPWRRTHVDLAALDAFEIRMGTGQVWLFGPSSAKPLLRLPWNLDFDESFDRFTEHLVERNRPAGAEPASVRLRAYFATHQRLMGLAVLAVPVALTAGIVPVVPSSLVLTLWPWWLVRELRRLPTTPAGARRNPALSSALMLSAAVLMFFFLRGDVLRQALAQEGRMHLVVGGFGFLLTLGLLWRVAREQAWMGRVALLYFGVVYWFSAPPMATNWVELGPVRHAVLPVEYGSGDEARRPMVVVRKPDGELQKLLVRRDQLERARREGELCIARHRGLLGFWYAACD